MPPTTLVTCRNPRRSRTLVAIDDRYPPAQMAVTGRPRSRLSGELREPVERHRDGLRDVAALPFGGPPHVHELEIRIFAEALAQLIDRDLLGARQRAAGRVPRANSALQKSRDVLEAHARQPRARLGDARLVVGDER